MASYCCYQLAQIAKACEMELEFPSLVMTHLGGIQVSSVCFVLNKPVKSHAQKYTKRISSKVAKLLSQYLDIVRAKLPMEPECALFGTVCNYIMLFAAKQKAWLIQHTGLASSYSVLCFLLMVLPVV